MLGAPVNLETQRAIVAWWTEEVTRLIAAGDRVRAEEARRRYWNARQVAGRLEGLRMVRHEN